MALPAFKLPRLQARNPIVDGRGQPSAAFVRYWNIDVLGSLESQVNSIIDIQNEIVAVQAELAAQLAQILAAQAAADAAQATADAALELATDANGARYVPLSGPVPSEVEADDITAEIMLVASADLLGVTIDADAALTASATLQEYDGVTWLDVASSTFNVNSNGTSPSPGVWDAASASFVVSGYGTYTGTVQYRVSIAKTGGPANFISVGSLSGSLVLTPKAVP